MHAQLLWGLKRPHRSLYHRRSCPDLELLRTTCYYYKALIKYCAPICHTLVIGHSVFVPSNTIRVTCPPSLVQYSAFITTRYSTEDQQFAMVKVPLHITFIIFVTASCCQYILSSPFRLQQNSLSPRTPLLVSFISLNLPQTEILTPACWGNKMWRVK